MEGIRRKLSFITGNFSSFGDMLKKAYEEGYTVDHFSTTMDPSGETIFSAILTKEE